MCKALHVINNLRKPEIGMPLTYVQCVTCFHSLAVVVMRSQQLSVSSPLHSPLLSSPSLFLSLFSSPRYKLLGVDNLMERLVNRHLHPLADSIAGFLKLKRDSILIHWA